jgi:hypothetical protein
MRRRSLGVYDTYHEVTAPGEDVSVKVDAETHVYAFHQGLTEVGD